MTDSDLRDRAPTAEEIERRLTSLPVKALRPLIWASVYGVGVVRRFGWAAHYECDLAQLDGPLIFAANHRSHVDTAAILDTMPGPICKRTVVAAALDVFGPDHRNGWRRRLSKDALQLLVAAGFHAFAFDRHGPPLRSVRTSTQLIRNGWNLLLYPEGTRSRTKQMASFKGGVGLLARFTGRPVIPVHVSGGERILPYCGFMPRGAIARVRFGSPLHFGPDDTPASFTQRVEDHVRLLGHRQLLHAGAAGGTGASQPQDLPQAVASIARKQPA